MNMSFIKQNLSRLVFVFLAVILLVMAVWVHQSSSIFAEKAVHARDDNIKLTTAAQQMRVDVIQIQQWLTDISATRGLDGLDDGFDEAENSYRSFIGGLGVFEQYYSGTDGNEAMLAQVSALQQKADSYYYTGQEMARAYIDEGPDGGNLMMAQFDDAAASLYDELDPFVNEQRAALGTAMDEIVSEASALKSATVVIFSIVFFVTFTGMFIQSKNNKDQINTIMETVKQAAEGDLTVSMHEKTGQLSRVSSSVNDLLSRFSEVMRKVKANADFVYTSAEQISDGNNSLSHRLQGQASSLEETASSMEEMTSTVKQNADAAYKASELANSTRDDAEKGGHVVQNASLAMRAINESSGKIADIVSTIDSIAFQTNLLALNAAVEAARAGEQGRGFAVVASEVRTLAQRSADAAKEIKTLIEDSVDKVKAGTEQVDQSGETLLGIVDGIKKVAELVGEINNASQEQSKGIDEVNTAVVHMDEAIQQNAAFIEESSSSSERMRDQAAVLNQVIEYFKLDNVIAYGKAEVPQINRPQERLPGA